MPNKNWWRATIIASIKMTGWHLPEASELLPSGEAAQVKPRDDKRGRGQRGLRPDSKGKDAE
ncbi:hypothetical protein [Moorella sp. E308F]|uniref:hypothetical protein n=1 Tax=Moorella sp. E308F TaxID=2572682 RepID=UPI0011443C96|nr:hypothetical protein [Moorella sp. E308F]